MLKRKRSNISVSKLLSWCKSKNFYVSLSTISQNMHIAIAGNIGSGKTTLATKLSSHYSWEPQFEGIEDNPYLNDFYNDMQRWAFHLQIYFLQRRFNQILKIGKSKKTIIQDRTIYEDGYIFAPNLHAMGLMTTKEYNAYFELFETVIQQLRPPELLIYLRASVPKLVEQIQRRGREYEDSIRFEYLRRLNERYEAWISTYNSGKLLIIDVDEC